MSSRRHTKISREGFYYLLVLSFVILVAVMRHINLLFILVGLLAAPIIFNWRIVVASLRRLRVQRKLPRMICAGDPLTVEISVANGRRRLDSWALVVKDTIALEGAAEKDQPAHVEMLLPHVAAGDSSRANYRCLLTRRGQYSFGPAKIISRFPFGLISATNKIDHSDRLIVCPRLGRLTPHWTRLLESNRAGSQRAQRRRGLMEGEFYGLREWRSGDSLRWIHWRTSAKLNEPTVRQSEQPRNHDLALVLDLWQGDNPGESEQDCVELAVSFAATAVADLCRRGGSRLTTAFVGAGGECRAANASMVFMEETMERLAVIQAGPCRQLSELLKEVYQEAPRQAPVIVVSTRARDEKSLSGETSSHELGAAELHNRLTWIDLSDGRWSHWFQIV